jgi:CRP-like cAMP-binding protein
MASTATTSSSNHLLASLSAGEYALLQPHLETQTLALRQRLEEPDAIIPYAVFPHSGLVSVVASAESREIEAGVIGREGMTGIAIVMCTDRSPHEVFVQSAGEGVRISADALRGAIAESRSLHAALLRFCYAFLAQTTYTALANGRATIEERLARWLLLAHDRSDGNTLTLTHEFLALMLGVRRAGVTIALQHLEARGLVTAERGSIVIADRDGLIEASNELYGRAESEYTRLTGWVPRAARA